MLRLTVCQARSLLPHTWQVLGAVIMLSSLYVIGSTPPALQARDRYTLIAFVDHDDLIVGDYQYPRLGMGNQVLVRRSGAFHSGRVRGQNGEAAPLVSVASTCSWRAHTGRSPVLTCSIM